MKCFVVNEFCQQLFEVRDDSLPCPRDLLIKTLSFNFSVFKIKNGQLVSYYQYLCFF